ncbi:HAD-IA family hydrolase [Nocardia puris]|uniref:HAD superfamily hydrolase (TIGR01493 family)/HAD superfamily hydrolase (TIGR01509 family)/HAD superfamily hydrolase (TIGR01549 family) n=1 Tax=Nocardia puris TaxID=208602 RepID=A0A366E1C9_9NOCA|nr:HAD-IA family hydrolase [Nocardia puris]MBF6209559.1 HAD-IA family hydrolase [Nocardia puris]MBF6366131.1 HAD-IA family hydrolase [Nocardia puris]MBF6458528.1 HAD-IA family hydrolase [Nocardia puris]RBO96176.1 HAD superfamily hydrolase (TIGR01493 family)/HAD superfamily hydrolase (TIGR01509 family)/HAD superfamily hydrolase (TIGR01549 family) [Nocardia puris]
MQIEAVLFDFSGTIFRLEEDESWGDELVGADGAAFGVEAKAEILRRMTAPVEQFMTFDAQGQHAWDNRDLDPALHRHAYLEVLRHSGVPSEEQAVRLYGRLIDPLAWTPYPDTGAVLEFLAAQGIPVGIVSNIAFDLRPALAARGWDRLIDAVALSYEVGAIKPDAKIFHAALDKLGVAPGAALMIGDSAEADGGALTIGARFAQVAPLPTEERPDALIDALRAHGLAVPR